jgi:ankyrin repeat protein
MSKLDTLPPELYRDIIKSLDPSSLISLHHSTKNTNIKAEVTKQLQHFKLSQYIKKDDLSSIKRLLFWYCERKKWFILNHIFTNAIRCNAINIVKFLLTKVDNLNINSKINGKLSIRYFIDTNNLELVKLFVKHPKFNPNIEQILVNAPSFFAVEILKHPFINPNIEKEQDTPLSLAVHQYDFVKINALLKHPKIKLNKKSFGNMTPLHLLMDYPYNIRTTNILELFLKHPQTKINLKNIEGETPLHISIRSRQPIKVIQMLLHHPDIKLGVKTYPLKTPNGKEIPGKTPLDYAYIYEYSSAYNLLEK